MLRKTIAAIFVASLMASGSANALTAKQVIEREVVVRNADGTETFKREKADLVVPGERVVYSINYYNDKAQAAEDIVLVMPVPKEVEYLERSAETPIATAEFSADGGNSFASRDRLTVRGATGTRPATASDITHIRWTVASIAPGTSGELIYKGRLK